MFWPRPFRIVIMNEKKTGSGDGGGLASMGRVIPARQSSKRGASIATPDQLPPPVDISQLPPQWGEPVDKILRHNDDLMARLSVNLRRISFLEGKVENLKKNNTGLAKHYHSLKDQLLIVQERSKNLNFRYKKRDTSLQQLEHKLQQTEHRYTQLQSSSQEEQAGLQRHINQLLRYKNRVRPLTQQALKQNKQLKSEIDILQESLLELEKKHQHSLQGVKDIQKQQALDTQAHELQRRNLEDQNSKLQTKLQDLELTKKENLSLKERLYEANTQHQLLKAKTMKEVGNANTIVTHYKSKIDIYKYECERLQNLLNLQKTQSTTEQPRAEQPTTEQPTTERFATEQSAGPNTEKAYDILNSEKLQLALRQIREKIKTLADDE